MRKEKILFASARSGIPKMEPDHDSAVALPGSGFTMMKGLPVCFSYCCKLLLFF